MLVISQCLGINWEMREIKCAVECRIIILFSPSRINTTLFVCEEFIHRSIKAV
jgi:hypothetical protein